MIAKLLTALSAVVVLASGCSKHEVRHLGGVIIGEEATVASSAEADAESPIVLQGTMTKKCPVAACWFMLTDQTGTIKVDLKNSEFVVADVPLKAQVTVSGRIAMNGTERVLEATGLRY